MTLAPFFNVAMTSPERQRSFRIAVGLHLGLASAVVVAVLGNPAHLSAAALTLLVAGIIEGAVLLGWRWTQLPKSQALEFLLVSPIQPKRVFYAEAFVGVARLALVILSGLPVVGVLVFTGRIGFDDFVVLLVMPFVCALACGVGITVWAYESRGIRRYLEWAGLGGIIAYLVIGVLAAEHLPLWLAWLPESMRWSIMETYRWMHIANPFSVMQYWFDTHRHAGIAAERLAGVALMAVGMTGLLTLRRAAQLCEHFHDRHYRPIAERLPGDDVGPGDWPLSWWAVRRVMEYSGRINLWLAGGFVMLYAAYIVAGSSWPTWMGRLVFQMIDAVGGVSVLFAALTVLAAVPACFQYGLWDSSVPERCRRLELLMLTQLDGRDYWAASAAAAWRRGRGYCAFALVLALAAGVFGRAPWAAVVSGVTAGVLLWGLYFSLGFWSFVRGRQASGLGSLLTLGVPALTILLARNGWTEIAALTPPGCAWSALANGPTLAWLPGPLLLGTAALVIGFRAHASCDRQLRLWYDRNHGCQTVR